MIALHTPSMLLFTLLCALVASTAATAAAAPPEASDVLEGKPEGYCSPSGPIEATNCAYETIEGLNTELFPAVHDLVSHPFFKYYKIDLYRECPFWKDDSGMCMNRACAVQEADEADIPEKWRARALSEVHLPDAQEAEGMSGCYFRNDDFCATDDDASPGGQYVDLTLNPERYTGYAGGSAHDIWKAIYQENCFGLSEASIADAKAGRGRSVAPPTFGMGPMGGDMQRAGLAPAETCEEKKLYYRVISGLHASIATSICANWLDRETGTWYPNLDCFIWRLAKFPERLGNVYFNAVLLLRAVARAAPYFHAYDIAITPPSLRLKEHTAREVVDDATRASFEKVLALAERADIASSFEERAFFTDPDAPVVMDQFKSHFRNVSRIMDCVGCDKCRMWGKLQVSGFGTALKILFALDEKDLNPKTNPDLLRRTEVVALFNTLHRVAETLHSVASFREMWAERMAQEAEIAAEKAKPAGDDVATTSHSWLGSGPGALATSVLAILEAVRRNCRGCVRAVARWLAGTRKTEL
ncbi:endoplasmic oxidoreductin [Cutaneotrichosporon oleaginosum]|uniref:Endoplasmic oxidoreductin n=1 Tax=Cutaneotrichosporon oleaginosum TaxID=879819 RepID=A0A0J0XHD5_9TREE|nr:endoplasmic oxidoreductin [Cutaneotrichosporon oleaginosum]KLT40473.1 endoplasmic oxidoreductin [Cutaneotrichosporon oleaginosum]TXT15336.1 hypothetical protein COLE_01529 [Cutaneotrichosporon oleaginosum]